MLTTDRMEEAPHKAVFSAWARGPKSCSAATLPSYGGRVPPKSAGRMSLSISWKKPERSSPWTNTCKEARQTAGQAGPEEEGRAEGKAFLYRPPGLYCQRPTSSEPEHRVWRGDAPGPCPTAPRPSGPQSSIPVRAHTPHRLTLWSSLLFRKGLTML